MLDFFSYISEKSKNHREQSKTHFKKAKNYAKLVQNAEFIGRFS